MTEGPKEESTVDAVYNLAIRSNEILVERINALDQKFKGLLTLSSAIAVLTTFLARDGLLKPSGCWLILVLVIFGLIVLISAYAMISLKKVAIVSPKMILDSDSYLGLSEFKKTVAGYYGWCFEVNNTTVIRKWKWFEILWYLTLAQIGLVVAGSILSLP